LDVWMSFCSFSRLSKVNIIYLHDFPLIFFILELMLLE
jgi:hypothetical protein